jgi:hypothetical protein
MKPIAKTVTQDFAHDKRSISYIIVKDTIYNDIRVQIFENGNFVNDVSCNNLNDAKKRVQRYIKSTVCPFYY